ncbi:MAG: alpha/beta hydrolase [Akkermansiaceae bacterium]|nr:alpha/beta hydrolase [Akkermansiaceae bacterium]MCP5542619.1 alpha/beta hydrolase [Akkermansiaceae bacterium]MCP5548268.1 alpha/beta hydrolase [Akkermansiaceae bacterium]
MNPSAKPSRSRSRWLGAFLVLLFAAIAPLALVTSCQSDMIYFPRSYPAGTTERWSSETKGRLLDYHTSQGRQRAFLQGSLNDPHHLWIVCGGNGTVALDWSDWLREHAPREDAYLLFDMPGYGDCGGKPNPSRIRESLQAVVPKAMAEVSLANQPERLRFFGHSLGAAVVMMAAGEFGIQRGVILSPFTSTMDMAREITGLPVGFLVWHRFDNMARLDDLERRGPGMVVIVHGADDEVIPAAMGRELADAHPDTCQFIEVPGARHNTIPESDPEVIVKALEAAGR